MERRAQLLPVLKRQKLITGEDLPRLVDAVCDGTISDEASLRHHVNAEFGVEPRQSWVRNTWRNIQATRPCTDLVRADPESHVPPPPPSMIELATAMRGLMYACTPVPLVAPPKSGVLDRKPDFDRNDWYLTNAASMEILVGEPRGVFEDRLCMVMLMGSRKYVTWCRRKHSSSLVSSVNSGRVELNRHATAAIQKGDLFTSMQVLDDDLGQLLMRDVDDVLFMMEKAASVHNTRLPRGFNVPPSHLLHRSLHELGGEWRTLEAYGQWRRAESKLEAAISDACKTAKIAKKYRKMVRRSPCQADIVEAMNAKVDAKKKEAKLKNREARNTYDATMCERAKMKQAVVDAIADCMLNKREVSANLHELNARLARLLETKDLAVLDVDSKVGDALKTLGMWSGSGPFPELTREAIKQASALAQKTHHPDKSGKSRPTVYPEEISVAKAVLYNHCEPEIVET